MPDTREKPPRRRRSRLARLARALALLALLAFGLWLARGVVLAPLVLRAAAWAGERWGDVELGADELGGTWLGSLEVRGFRLRALDPTMQLHTLDAARARVEYSLVDLALGKPTWLRAIELEGVAAAADLGRGGPLGPIEDPIPWDEPPPGLPRVEIEDAALELVLEGGGAVLLRGIAVATESRPAGKAFELEIASLALTGVLAEERSAHVSAELVYAERVLTLASLDLDDERVLFDSRLDLGGVTRGALGFDLNARAFAGSAHLAGSLRGEGLRGNLSVRELDVSAALSALPLVLAPAPDARVDLALEFAIPLAAPLEAAATLTLSARDARVGELVLERAEVGLRLEHGALRDGRLALASGPNELVIDELALPLDALFDAAFPTSALGLASGRLELGARDLARVVAALDAALAARLPAHELALAARLASGVVTLERGRLDACGARLVVERAALVLADLGLDARVRVVLADAARLGELVGTDLAGRAELQAELTGRWPALDARLSASAHDVAALGATLATLELGGSLGAAALELDAARGRIELTASALDLAGVALERVSGVLTLAGGELVLERLDATSGADRLTARALRVPVATLAAGDAGAILGALAGELELAASDLGRWAGGGTALELPPHTLALRASVQDGALRLASGALETKGGAVSIESGALTLRARPPATLDDVELALELAADFADLAPLGVLVRTASPGALAGSLAGRLAASGSLAHPALEAELRARELVVAGAPIGPLSLRAAFAQGTLQVDELRAGQAGDELALSGALELDPWRVRALELEGAVLDLARYAAGASGALRVSASADGPLSALAGELALSGARLVVLGVDVPALELRVEAADGAARCELTARAATLGEVQASVRIEGPADGEPALVLLDALSLADGALALARPTSVRVGDELAVDELELVGDAGLVTLTLARDAGATRARASARALRPGAFVALPSGVHLGALTGELELDLAPSELTLSARGRLAGLRLGAGLPELDVELLPSRLAGGSARLGGLSLYAGGAELARVEGTLPLDLLAADPRLPGELTARGWVRVSALDELVPAARELGLAGGVRARFELSGTWAEPRAQAWIASAGLALSLPGGLDEPLEVELAAALSFADELRIERARAALVGRAFVRASGSAGLALGPLVDDLARGAARDLSATPLDLELALGSPDLAFLAQLVPDLRRSAGALRGALALGGTLGAPNWSGTLALAGGEAKLAADVGALSSVDASLVFAQHEVTLERVAGELGGAPFALAGKASLRAPFAVELTLDGDNLLLLRRDGIKVRADAALTLSGPLATPTLGGGVVLRDSLFAQKLDFLALAGGGPSGPVTTLRGIQLFSFPDPPLANFAFDLAIDCEEPFRIANNMAKGKARPKLRLSGTGEVPILTGQIFLEPTRVSLPASTLFVRAGTITFAKDDPFLPRLDLTAGTKMLGYDVTLQISGPYDQPEVLLSSVPPLSSQELALLVLTGQPPKSGLSRETGVAAAKSVSVFIAKDVVTRFFASESLEGSEESFFDRFDFSTGREISRTGTKTIESSFRLRRAALSPDDTLFLMAERDVYDDVNLGLRLVFKLR